MPVGLGRLSQQALEQTLAAAAHAPLSYDRADVESMRTWSLVLGTGDDVFAAAVERLRTWVPQRAIGARVHPGDAPLVVGTTLVVVLSLGPFEVAAPNRIVAVIDQPDEFGYSYGTLPGHPEQGEERFAVRRAPDGTVVASIGLWARPAWRTARLAGPMTRFLQRRAVRTYLRALSPSRAGRRGSRSPDADGRRR